MPVFRLDEDVVGFPDPNWAREDGLLAIGGGLTPEWLLEAYALGIFPWYNANEPILWWSPDPRFVLYPDELKISRTMRQTLQRGTFKITFDTAFEQVISACSTTPRHGQDGTWITDDVKKAYTHLHELGLAHSVEAWQDDKLVGGLYGISLGRCFFGESMFSHVSNASKAAFLTLVPKLRALDFVIIDCQMSTPHLESLGGRGIPRQSFLDILETALPQPTLQGSWTKLLAD